MSTIFLSFLHHFQKPPKIKKEKRTENKTKKKFPPTTPIIKENK